MKGPPEFSARVANRRMRRYDAASANASRFLKFPKTTAMDAHSSDSRNLKAVVEYDGADYCGWQIQAGAPSIQAALVQAIAKINGAPVAVHAAGRTDAGVHAQGQVIHAHVGKRLPEERWKGALNAHLPPDIRVRSVVYAAPDFHARRSARAKLYRYQFWRGNTVSPFWRRYVTDVPATLAWDAMRDASGALVGTHDFAPFSVAHLEVATTVREIFSVAWRDVNEDVRCVEFYGTGFLRYQVRRMVGTLLDIGRRRLPASAIGDILRRTPGFSAGATAPPQGLTLVQVDY
jgi:tRNA pseudouridine38-40 synthase